MDLTQKEAELRSRLTPEFLNTLVEVARTCGWNVDHIETISFVAYCHDLAGITCPSLDPYEC